LKIPQFLFPNTWEDPDASQDRKGGEEIQGEKTVVRQNPRRATAE
jgi:hypothetical protein